MPMIELWLKCKCTDGEVKLQVREREDEEDIRDYMAHLTQQVGAWHANRGCPESALEYMKIPLADRDGVGIGRKA